MSYAHTKRMKKYELVKENGLMEMWEQVAGQTLRKLGDILDMKYCQLKENNVILALGGNMYPQEGQLSQHYFLTCNWGWWREY